MKASVRLIGPFAAVAVALLALSIVENSQAAASQTTAEAPVEFIYGGITPDKAKISYKIKVNTDKPIEEVHMNLKEMDASGKVLLENTLIWQNIVHSTRQPIEKGKTYEDTMMLNPGAVKVECSFKEVIFKDDTRSQAQGATPLSPAPTIATVVPSVTPERTPVTNSLAPRASGAALFTQAEAESFIRSVYRDMEQDDLNKVLANFDKTVDYYAYGRKDKAFIAEQLRQYFAAFPIRSFSVGEVRLQASSSTASKVSLTFEVRYSLRDASKGTTSTGRSHVDWDLVKRDSAPKIVRFTGTSYPDASAPDSH
jgi:hypothetical protein